MTDLHFQEQGSVWLVQPITPKGEAWMTDHTSARALRWFGAIEIDCCLAENMFNGARTEALPVEQTDAFLAALADMKVTITGQNGEQLAIAQGSAVLGHPLNAVLWLRDSGVTFKAGDMISVGSIGPLLPPKSGLTATVTYDGLPGNPAIRVSFE